MDIQRDRGREKESNEREQKIRDRASAYSPPPLPERESADPNKRFNALESYVYSLT